MTRTFEPRAMARLDDRVAPAPAPTPAPPRSSSLLFLRHLATTGALLVLLDLTVYANGLLAARLLSMLLLTTLPGVLLLAAGRLCFAGRFEHVAFAVGASLFVLMAWSAIASFVLPPLGIARPLDSRPMIVAVNVIIAALALCCPMESDPVLRFVGNGRSSPRGWLSAGALVALPLVALAGVTRLNNGKGSALALIAIGLVALVLLVGLALAGRIETGRIQAALLSAALALLLLYTYRSNHPFGFDIQQEYQRFNYVLASGRWTPPASGDPYASMLSITALPAVLVKLTGISGTYLFKGMYPVLLAFVPGLAFGFARKWLPGRAAFVGAAYIVVLPQFVGQLSSISRQEVGLFFFALMILAVFSLEIGRVRRQVVIIVVLAALVVSHYSTSYVTVALFAVTWLVYGTLRGLARLRGGQRPAAGPLIGAVTVLAGIALIVGWDVGVTHSTSNVTTLSVSVAQKGLDVLPNGDKGSLISRWVNGNVAPVTSPLKYYHLAKQASIQSQPWLNAYPASLTSRYPAAAAPRSPVIGPRLAVAGRVYSDLQIPVAEGMLALSAIGAIGVLWVRRKGSGPPLEVALLGVAFLGFAAVLRVSGTVAGSYNQERAQLQAAIVLCIGLGVSAGLLLRRLGTVGALALAGALVIMLIGGTGLQAELGGGAPSVITANSGRAFDQFYITDEEVASARWMVDHARFSPLMWTDQYGELRIWDATGYAAATQVDITPATIDQGGWIYVTGYNIERRGYGQAAGATSEYEFPTAFLHDTKALVYSSPRARIYR